MRKINALITPLIMVLFLVHMIRGGLELAGMTKGGSSLFMALSHLMLALIAVHAVISISLTVDTIRISRRKSWTPGKQ